MTEQRETGWLSAEDRDLLVVGHGLGRRALAAVDRILAAREDANAASVWTTCLRALDSEDLLAEVETGIGEAGGDEAWAAIYATDAIRAHIRELRAALHPDPSEPA